MYSEWKRPEWVIMYTWKKDDNLLKYVMGEGMDYTIPWAIVDIFYVSYNILNLHWILVKIDLVACKLLIWHSLKSMTTQLEIEGHWKVMRTVVVVLLDNCGMTTTWPNLQLIPWTMEQVQDVTQQTRSRDYGVFFAKFFKYIVTGSPYVYTNQGKYIFF